MSRSRGWPCTVEAEASVHSDELDMNAPVPSGSTGVIKVLFVISDGGRHVHEVVSELTPPGSTTGPAPTQTSVDVWKVAAGQNH
jgi:hypothetical protein